MSNIDDLAKFETYVRLVYAAPLNLRGEGLHVAARRSPAALRQSQLHPTRWVESTMSSM
jgi:hypothetical protein